MIDIYIDRDRIHSNKHKHILIHWTYREVNKKIKNKEGRKKERKEGRKKERIVQKVDIDNK